MALDKELIKILESGALFRLLEYSVDIHGFTTNYTLVALPKLIERDCDVCKIRTLWECGTPTWDTKTAFGLRSYKCRNCEIKSVRFAIMWGRNGESMLFQKFGENPKPEVSITKELEGALGKEDASLYRRALISANISHGLAAVAYARRVVENKVDVLLDLTVEAAILSGVDVGAIADLAAVKASRQVERKIEMASQLLPKHLRPGGHNPITALYSNLSEALHGKSDAECQNVFEELRFVFEYLFRNRKKRHRFTRA